MRVTIKHIAVQLGISASTVSRALKDDARITREVKLKVLQLSQQLGYRPNLLARGLVSSKTYTIGFMVDNLSWSYFSELAEYVQTAAEKYGYSALIYSSLKNPSKEKQGIESFLSRGVDGLLISTTEADENNEYFQDLSRRNFPIVIYNDIPGMPLDAVVPNYYAGAVKVMDHLIGCGHTRIHYIGVSESHAANRQKIQAFQDAFVSRSLSVPKDGIHLRESDPLSGYRAAKKALQSSDRPTAFFIHNDTIAMGVYRAIYEMGLTIPSDVSVVGYDNLENSQFVHPPLTTVDIKIKKLADKGVELLMKRIDSDDVEGGERSGGVTKWTYEPKLVVRSSTVSLTEESSLERPHST